MYGFNYDTWKTTAPDDDEANNDGDPAAGEAEEFYLAAADLAQMREMSLIKQLEAEPEGAANSLADTYDPCDRF